VIIPLFPFDPGSSGFAECFPAGFGFLASLASGFLAGLPVAFRFSISNIYQGAKLQLFGDNTIS
jgi:hypothetical protein